MSDSRYERVKEIYYEAAMLDAAERESFIKRTCNGDHALRDELERLFHAEACAGEFMEQPAVSSGALRDVALQSLEDAAGTPLPERLGRYRILRLLGEGGMGSVYEAEQDSPKRRVALKVLRAGSMQPRMLQRFQREVEVLGRLQHPNIARIYDAGVAEIAHGDGRVVRVPYFAMELIEGHAITAYADKRGLSMRDRLAMLAEVCDAVHYGHQHGIVHRDLKPANVMVGHSSAEAAKHARADGTPHSMPVPKVIDFGVARVTNADITMTTLATDAGQMIGTLAYMSPEQVQGNPLNIDARSDIYALGVIGYELLTGRLPYEVSDKIAPEAARIIRDEEPSRMSSISRVYRGDVETIFAKALEKEPSRRYDSAAALAADIRRYLKDEPIIARPPTLRYQLGKLAKRHREFVAGLVLVFIVLIAGIVGTAFALVHALNQEKAATLAKTSALNAAASARTEAERARTESIKAQRVSEMMQRILSYAAPGTPGGGRDIKVVEMLDIAADELLGQLADAPEIEITLRRTLGETYARLGEDDTAQRHFARALQLAEQVFGRDSLEWLDLAAAMAVAKLWKPGETDLPIVRALADDVTRWLALARTKAPRDHPTIQRLLQASGRVNSTAWRMQIAIADLNELLEILQSLPQERRVVTEVEVKAALVYPLLSTLTFDRVEEMAREVLDSMADAPPMIAFDYTVNMLNFMGLLRENEQRLDEAADCYRRSLDMQMKARGADHPTTLATVAVFRNLMLRMGRFSEALEFNALEREPNERISPDAAWLAYIYAYEGLMLSRLGREDDAKPWFEKAITHRGTHIGDDWLVQEWWRGGTASEGSLFRPWRSECLRRFTWSHVNHALRQAPTTTFALHELDWSQARYTLERWNGEGVPEVVDGPFAELREIDDPEPGVIRLKVHCPRNGGEEFVAGGWLLAAPWKLDLFRAYRDSNAVDQTQAVLAGPHEFRELPTLAFEQSYVDSLGPAGAHLSFDVHATAQVRLPPGRYNLRARFDDGARLWMDGQLLFDGFDGAGRHPGVYETEVEFDDRPHELRVEYFQHGQNAMLWISAAPVVASREDER